CASGSRWCSRTSKLSPAGQRPRTEEWSGLGPCRCRRRLPSGSTSPRRSSGCPYPRSFGGHSSGEIAPEGSKPALISRTRGRTAAMLKSEQAFDLEEIVPLVAVASAARTADSRQNDDDDDPPGGGGGISSRLPS